MVEVALLSCLLVEARLAVALLAMLAASHVAGAAFEPRWQVVTFDGPIHPEDRAALDAHAVLVADYLPPYGYLALVPAGGRDALLAEPGVRGVADLPLAAKAPRDTAFDTGRVRVVPFPGEDAGGLAGDLLRAGAAEVRVARGPDALLDVDLGRLPVARLIAHPGVRWAEPLRATVELDNARASSIVQSGADADWSVHAQGVDGSTQIVGYCDTGLDTDAPDAQLAGRALHEQFADGSRMLLQNVPSPFHRKVALYYAPIDERGLRGDMDDEDGHGTHVAGTLAGDAGTWGARGGNDGVAYGARLAVCDAAHSGGFQLLSDYAGYWDPAYDAGARVHSNSWGLAPTGEYTLAARQHDAYLWRHRDLVLVRSVGNTGEAGPRAEAVAKSVLAVGATSNDAADERVMEYSGRGPTVDGRLKPDLVAPGDCVRSAGLASPTAYVCLRGTSQATPVVAGAAALVRDHFAKGFHPTGVASPDDAREVTSALVRALLVASAVPVSSELPDSAQGWGRPELDSVLPFAGGPLRLLARDEDAALATGATWETTFDVAEGGSLRVVLAWTDAPAALGASSTLVNDLDLEVVAPSGAIHLGNADLAAPDPSTPDRTNVFERVVLPATEAGAYTLRVRGWNVPVGAQPFALVAIARSG